MESAKLDLDDIDRANEDIFNRILWHARRGRDDTYPQWAVGARARSRSLPQPMSADEKSNNRSRE
jgi:hypothetical protein